MGGLAWGVFGADGRRRALGSCFGRLRVLGRTDDDTDILFYVKRVTSAPVGHLTLWCPQWMLLRSGHFVSFDDGPDASVRSAERVAKALSTAAFTLVVACPESTCCRGA